jgi:hypothetical protein
MLSTTINRLSDEFLAESVNSPRLLEDLSSMEKYIAESYGGRTYIELLQNADDAGASRIRVMSVNNSIIIANDGRPFTAEDVMAICRSGASTKQRGISIGYRGVGFKSTAYLTEEIIIYSENTYFTFSKNKCSVALGTSTDKVPTIRVPFLIKQSDISIDVMKAVDQLISVGYTTAFILNDVKLQVFSDELSDVDNGYFLFLRNICSAEIEVSGQKILYTIERIQSDNKRTVSFSGSKTDKWLIIDSISNKHTSIAIKLDTNNTIIPCEDDEAVFHCYLPSLDKTGYPFKINSDFSTDPSRKHIVLDDITNKALSESAEIFFQVIKNIICDGSDSSLSNMLSMCLSKSSFTKLAIDFNNKIKTLITKDNWLALRNARAINITDYKLFPEWIEETEARFIRENAPLAKDLSLKSAVYQNHPQIDRFIKPYSNQVYSANDFSDILKDKRFVSECNSITVGKIFANSVKSSRTKQAITGVKLDYSDCYLHGATGIEKLSDMKQNSGLKLDSKMLETISSVTSPSDIEWFCNEYELKTEEWQSQKNQPTGFQSITRETVTVSRKIAVTKWRSAEQQCVEIEQFLFTASAIDVSKQNLGYDVVSTTPDGGKRYIEVKSLNNKGDTFTMTNNEYTAAHQHNSNYFICLIIQANDQLNAVYIQDPVNNLQLDKRVRQWEWFCESYNGEQFSIEY